MNKIFRRDQIKISKGKMLIIKFGIAIVLAIASSVIIFSILDKAHSQDMASKYLISVTNGVNNTVDSWIGEKKKQLILISELPEIKKGLENGKFTDSGIKDKLELIKEHDPNIENIFIVSPKGTILSGELSLAANFEEFENPDFWKRFKKSGNEFYLDTYVSRSHKTGKLIFILVKGIFSGSDEPLGFVGFTINWDKFIQQFIISVKLGKTGYLAITDTIGRNIGHFDASLNLRELSEYPWMKKLISEKNGFQRYSFRNETKLMAYLQSKETGWIINASIKEEELIGKMIRLRNIVLCACFLFLIIFLFLMVYLDMFKLETVERSLLESKRNFKLLFDRSSDGVFIHAIKPKGEVGRFTKVNDAFLKLFNISESSILSQTPSDFFKMDERDYSMLMELFFTGKIQPAEMKLIVNGEPMWVEFHLFLIENNRNNFVMGFVHDITERVLSRLELKKDRDILNKKVEEHTNEILRVNQQLRNYIREKEKIAKALSESEMKYRTLIELANDGIMLIFQKKISFVNTKICTLLKYEKPQLTGLIFEDLISPIDKGRIMDNHNKRLQGITVPEIFETSLQASDGEFINVEINAGIINDEDGRKDFLFIRDISLRKKNEEEQRKKQEQLIQTDKLVALGTLVSGVAHEINNPNNAIMLNNSIIKKAWESTKPILDKFREENGDFIISGMPYSFFKNYYADIIDEVQKNSGKIKTIVEDLKNFARPDTGILCEEVDVNEVIHSVIKLLSNQIFHSTLNFSFLPNELPPIEGNFVRLEQVFVNLLQNACHALTSPLEAIRVTSSYLPEEGMVEVLVSDSGEGITEENLKYIFDPFFTMKRDKGGVGLGLSVSLKIIKEHNGSISFQSKIGEGTTVSVKLPAKNKNDGKSETC